MEQLFEWDLRDLLVQLPWFGKLALWSWAGGLNCNIWALVPKRESMTKAPSNTKCQVLKTLRFHNAPASVVLSRSWLVHLSQQSHEAATTITSILPMKILQHGEIKWFSQSLSWSMAEAGFQFGILTPEQVFLWHVTLPLCDKGKNGYLCYYCFRVLHSRTGRWKSPT